MMTNHIPITRLFKDTKTVVRALGKGQSFVITRRGKPIARLVPIGPPSEADDPLYRLHELARTTLEPMTNAEIDRLVYRT